jgi:hypothetical protein
MLIASGDCGASTRAVHRTDCQRLKAVDRLERARDRDIVFLSSKKTLRD